MEVVVQAGLTIYIYIYIYMCVCVCVYIHGINLQIVNS